MAETVSVVIATRNRPEMLREAVASALAQDHPGPLEVIVVHDQSPVDSTLEMRTDDRQVSVVSNSRSPGLAGARNCGIEVSSGDYVAFCDDDDYWAPSRVREQLELMRRFPKAGLATCGIRVEYADESFERVLPREQITFEELLRDRHTELHPSTFLLRRSVLERDIGLVDEAVPGGFGEDYEFLLRAARVHVIVNVQAPLTVVRWGQQSFFFRRWETMAAGLTWLLERYPEFERSRRGSGRIRGQIAFAHAAMGDRRATLWWASGAIRRSPGEPRIYLALAVASRLVTPDRVMETLHRRGRGI